MSRLKKIHNQMEDEYIQTLRRLPILEFLRSLREIISFPDVTFKLKHIECILERLCERYAFPPPDDRKILGNALAVKLWKNILATDKSSLLNPECNRSSIVGKWLSKDWHEDVLEVMAAGPEWKELMEKWMDRAGKENLRGSRKKTEIVYEQCYRLASNEKEKYKILISALNFYFLHFRLNDNPTRLAFLKGRIGQMLKRHIHDFPDRIPCLRDDFYKMIVYGNAEWRQQAGWVGMSIVGAGTYEDTLFERLKLITKGVFKLEEIYGMMQWVPSSAKTRQKLFELWMSIMDSIAPSDMGTNREWWESVACPIIWQTCFQMETEEEQLLSRTGAAINAVVMNLHIATFLKLHGDETKKLPSEQVMEVLAAWCPRRTESHSLRELWENGLIKSLEIESGHALDKFWKGLLTVAPRHSGLGTLLLKYLSKDRFVDNNFCSLERSLKVINSWLREHGLPPQTSLKLRERLAETALDRLLVLRNAGWQEKPLFNYTTALQEMSQLAFHLMASVPSDPEGKNHQKREKIIAGILEETTMLSIFTDVVEKPGNSPTGIWQKFIHQQWEKKLANLEPSTATEEARKILEYFTRTINRTPEFQPTGILKEKLLLLIRESTETDLVVMAARMGKHLIARADRVDSDFLNAWAQAVLEREVRATRERVRPPDSLATHLHLVRKECVLQELNRHLGEGKVKSSTGTAKSLEPGVNPVRDGNGPDELIFLRRLIYRFPDIEMEIEGRASLPRIWSQESINILVNSGKKRESLPIKPCLPDMPGEHFSSFWTNPDSENSRGTMSQKPGSLRSGGFFTGR